MPRHNRAIPAIVVVLAVLYVTAIGAAAYCHYADCVPVRDTTPDVTGAGYVTVTHIRVDRQFLSGREGIVVFVNARNVTGLVSGTSRYPRDGLVWDAQPGTAYPLRPLVSFPMQRDVSIEMGVFVVPKDAGAEAIRALSEVYSDYMAGRVSGMAPRQPLGDLRDSALASKFGGLTAAGRQSLAVSWLVDALTLDLDDAARVRDAKSGDSAFTIYLDMEPATR